MCHQLTESHSCGHEETHTIPCESKVEQGACTAAPDACKDSTSTDRTACSKCREKEAEEAELAQIMKQIAEDPNLAPAPKTATKPAGNFGFLKTRNRWLKCGHVSDPEETMVERDSLDEPEWLDVDARGFCYRCSELPPQEYHDRKAAGELDGDDPWGELSVTPAAVAGGSGSKPKYSQRAIASGIPDPTPKKLLQVDDYAVDLPSHPAYDDDSDEEQPAAISRPSSPDQAPTLTRAKGKGRVGQPEETYAPRYGAPEPVQAEPETESEDDDAPVHSDLEDEIRRPKGKAPKSKAPKEEEEPSTEDEDEDEVETIPRGSRKSTTTIRDQGNKSSRSAARAESNSSSSSSQSSDYEGDEDDDDYAAGPPPGNPPTEGVAGEPFFIISPEDRAKYGIPPGHPLTERQFEAWKDRRAAEGRRAMAQHAKGEIDEE